MKKIILLCIITITSCTLFAQFKKGDKIIEAGVGDLYYYKYKSDPGSTLVTESKKFGSSIIPGGGYFVNPRIAVGTGLYIYFGNEKGSGENINKIKTYDSKSHFLRLGISPFIRYYFHQNTRSGFYGQLAGGISSNILDKSTSSNYNGTTGALESNQKNDGRPKDRDIFINPSLGWNYFFTPHSVLNLNIGYTFFDAKSSTKTITTSGNGQQSYNTFNYKAKTSELRWHISYIIVLPAKKKQ